MALAPCPQVGERPPCPPSTISPVPMGPINGVGGIRLGPRSHLLLLLTWNLEPNLDQLRGEIRPDPHPCPSAWGRHWLMQGRGEDDLCSLHTQTRG